MSAADIMSEEKREEWGGEKTRMEKYMCEERERERDREREKERGGMWERCDSGEKGRERHRTWERKR